MMLKTLTFAALHFSIVFSFSYVFACFVVYLGRLLLFALYDDAWLSVFCRGFSISVRRCLRFSSDE